MSKEFLRYDVTQDDRDTARALSRNAKPGKTRDNSAYLNALGVIAAVDTIPHAVPGTAAIGVGEARFAVRTMYRARRPLQEDACNVNAEGLRSMVQPSILWVSYSEPAEVAYVLGFMSKVEFKYKMEIIRRGQPFPDNPGHTCGATLCWVPVYELYEPGMLTGVQSTLI